MPVGLRDGEMRQRRRGKRHAAVSQGPTCRIQSASDCNARHDHNHHVERDFQRSGVPLDGRPCDVDDRDAAGPLPLRRHPLVLDHIRPRRHHHGDADAVVRLPYRQRRIAAAGGLSSHQIRSDCRRRTWKSPARNARRRNGGAARSAVRALLWQRGCDAVIRVAGRPLCRAYRRRRDTARTLAQRRSGAGLDRRAGRPRP